MKRVIGFILYTISYTNFFYCQQCLNKTINYDDVVHLAYSNRKDLEASKNAINVQKYSERSALSAYLPQIQATGYASGTNSEGLPMHLAKFEINQLIFSPAGPLEQFRIEKENTAITTEQYNLKRDIIRNSAENTFFSLQKNLLQQLFDNTLKISSKAIFEKSKESTNQGFLSSNEWLDAQKNHEQDNATIIKDNYAVMVAFSFLQREVSTDLKQVVFATPEQLESLVDNLFRLPPVEDFHKKALLNRKELTIKEHEICRETLNEKFYKKSYLPNASFFGNISRSKLRQSAIVENILDVIYPSTTWQVGINFSWEFDGFTKAYYADRSYAQRRSLELQQQDLKQQIIADVNQNFNNLKSLLGQIQATKKNLETQRQNYEKILLQEQIGEQTPVDVAVAKTTLKQAETSWKSLVINIIQTHQQLLFVCGYPQQIA